MTPMPALLDMRAVSKLYAGTRRAWGLRRGNRVRALSNVSLSVQHGEVLGLVGESGSGKSTLGRIAIGLERPSEGEIRIRGRDLSLRPIGARTIEASFHPDDLSECGCVSESPTAGR